MGRECFKEAATVDVQGTKILLSISISILLIERLCHMARKLLWQNKVAHYVQTMTAERYRTVLSHSRCSWLLQEYCDFCTADSILLEASKSVFAEKISSPPLLVDLLPEPWAHARSSKPWQQAHCLHERPLLNPLDMVQILPPGRRPCWASSFRAPARAVPAA